MSSIKSVRLVKGKPISPPVPLQRRQTTRARHGRELTRSSTLSSQRSARRRPRAKRSSLKRLVSKIWKRITRFRLGHPSIPFAFIPPGVTQVTIDHTDDSEEDQTRLRASRRQGGYWAPSFPAASAPPEPHAAGIFTLFS